MAELMPWEDPPTGTARGKEPMPWEDAPVESVQSKVVNYYMPEPPGAPKIAALQPGAPGPPGFGQRLYEQTLAGPVSSILGAFVDPKRQLQETIANLTAQQIQAVRNPMQVQGQAAPIIEDVRTGNLPGAGGGVTGLGLTLLAPKILEKTPGAAKVAGAGVRAAAPDVAMGTAKLGAGYVMEQIPGTGYLKYALELPTAYSGAKQIGRGLKKGIAASRAELAARAARAAEVLAEETAAARKPPPPPPPPPGGPPPPPPEPPPAPGPPPTRPQPVPAEPVVTPPPEPVVTPPPATPAPPAPGPPPTRPQPVPAEPVVTPPPEPVVTPPPATPAPSGAAQQMREAMGLQPGQFEAPAFEAPGVAEAARKTQIDRVARMLQQEGIDSKGAGMLDPPQLADLAKAVGMKDSLGAVAKEVKLRMQEIEKAQAETAKYQAAYDKLKPSEKAAVRGEAEPGATPAAPETPAEALAKEMGYARQTVAEPRTVQYIRNTEKSPKLGSLYAQDVEPAGKYVIERPETFDPQKAPGWEAGEVTFRNPLVLDWGGAYLEPTNWKHALSKRYGGRTGKALSKAIAADGYDGIITMENGVTSEIVDLSQFAKPKK